MNGYWMRSDGIASRGVSARRAVLAGSSYVPEREGCKEQNMRWQVLLCIVNGKSAKGVQRKTASIRGQRRRQSISCLHQHGHNRVGPPIISDYIHNLRGKCWTDREHGSVVQISVSKCGEERYKVLVAKAVELIT